MNALGSMSINVITLFVEDLRAAKSFYQEIFGIAAAYEDERSAAFDFANMSLYLLQHAAARAPITPEAIAWRETGPRIQLTLILDDVDDLDAARADLSVRGVNFIDGLLNPCGVRTVCFADPNGHIWELAQ